VNVVVRCVYDGPVRWVLASWVALVGCGGVPARDEPRETLHALTTALRDRDASALAVLLGRPEEEVAAPLAEAPEQLSALADRVDAAPVEESARVYVVSGERIRVVREDGGWRVDRGLLGAPALARPEDAVLALHDALARARWADLAAVLASGPRAELEDEARRWLEGTRDVDALEVSVDGDTATVRTPTGGAIDLVRESGEWRIVELR
jgi:hypothetical protein